MIILKINCKPNVITACLRANGNVIDGKTFDIKPEYFMTSTISGYYIIEFDSDVDAIAFKLRWPNLDYR